MSTWVKRGRKRTEASGPVGDAVQRALSARLLDTQHESMPCSLLQEGQAPSPRRGVSSDSPRFKRCLSGPFCVFENVNGLPTFRN